MICFRLPTRFVDVQNKWNRLGASIGRARPVGLKSSYQRSALASAMSAAPALDLPSVVTLPRASSIYTPCAGAKPAAFTWKSRPPRRRVLTVQSTRASILWRDVRGTDPDGTLVLHLLNHRYHRNPGIGKFCSLSLSRACAV